MNSIFGYLAANWQRLGLDRYGLSRSLSCLMVTPRFRASGHVVFLIASEGKAEPMLVVKVPRLAGDGATLVREASALQALQNSRPGGNDVAPRLVALDECWDRPLLLETALAGRPMDPPLIRRDLAGCCQVVISWLSDLHKDTRVDSWTDPDWFERLVMQPVQILGLAAGDEQLTKATRQLVAPLQECRLPLVFAHGDLSHPNILIRENKHLGVLDWENAESRGLPINDLFFFLAYAAFALHRTRKTGKHLKAFKAAFFGPGAWALPYVEEFISALDLEFKWLTPLFVLTWVRYLAGLLERMQVEAERGIATDTQRWLRSNRYYALWRQSVLEVDSLSWRYSSRVRAK